MKKLIIGILASFALVVSAHAQTFGAVTASNLTVPQAGLVLRGTGTGLTTFSSANAGSSNFTLTVPAVSATLAVLGANTFTAAQTLPGVISGGTKFTASGCSNSTTVGGATAGSFASGTTGTCTVVITMNGATGLTAPNGWVCKATDQTTVADVINQTSSTTTTATISGTTISGDVIPFSCVGY